MIEGMGSSVFVCASWLLLLGLHGTNELRRGAWL